MIIDTNEIISVTEANQNFTKVSRIVDHNGHAVIFKNNKPKYIMYNIDENPIFELTDDEKIDVVARRILKEYKDAFLELAK